MATLTGIRGPALARQYIEPLGPVAADPDPASLATSQRFSIGEAGQSFIAIANGQFHLVCGDSTITATTASAGPFPAGAYHFTLPDGCTHVAMIQGAAGAATGCAYPG